MKIFNTETKMPLNPWLVDNIEAFSFYCCPECVFRSKEENFFQVHALQNHGQAKSFFLDPENNGAESNQSIFYGDKTNQVQVKKEVFEKHEGNLLRGIDNCLDAACLGLLEGPEQQF